MQHITYAHLGPKRKKKLFTRSIFLPTQKKKSKKKNEERKEGRWREREFFLLFLLNLESIKDLFVQKRRHEKKLMSFK